MRQGKKQWKIINRQAQKWSRSHTGGSTFKTLTGKKNWCFGLAVVYGGWSHIEVRLYFLIDDQAEISSFLPNNKLYYKLCESHCFFQSFEQLPRKRKIAKDQRPDLFRP